MFDLYEDTAQSLSAPAAACFAISPDDNADLPQATKALYVGVGGDISLLSVGSDIVVTFVGVVSGSILPVRVRAVHVTGTTADALVGLA